MVILSSLTCNYVPPKVIVELKRQVKKMNVDLSNPIYQTSVALAEVAVRNTTSAITNKIKSSKAKRDDKETINELTDIINELLADKSELIMLSKIYEDEFLAQKLKDEDIKYITDTVVPTAKKIIGLGNVDDETLELIDNLESLISLETLKVLQLLGFNFNKGVGDPLTNKVRDLIEGEKEKEIDKEIAKFRESSNSEYYKMINNEEAYARFIEDQNRRMK